jgi:hypothetical protein
MLLHAWGTDHKTGGKNDVGAKKNSLMKWRCGNEWHSYIWRNGSSFIERKIIKGFLCLGLENESTYNPETTICYMLTIVFGNVDGTTNPWVKILMKEEGWGLKYFKF